MLKAVEELSKVDDTAGIIVVESDDPNSANAMEELNSLDARRVAISTAAKLGLPDPRICGTVQRYPVDASGEVVINPLTQQTVKYRADVPVTRRLV